MYSGVMSAVMVYNRSHGWMQKMRVRFRTTAVKHPPFIKKHATESNTTDENGFFDRKLYAETSGKDYLPAPVITTGRLSRTRGMT